MWRIHRPFGYLLHGRTARGTTSCTPCSARPAASSTTLLLAPLAALYAAAHLSRECTVRPLPGGREVVQQLSLPGVPYAIASGGAIATASSVLDMLGLPDDHPRPGRACQAVSAAVPSRDRGSRFRTAGLLRRRRQRQRPAGGPPRRGTMRRRPVWRAQARPTAGGRRLPGLRRRGRPARPARPARRGRVRPGRM